MIIVRADYLVRKKSNQSRKFWKFFLKICHSFLRILKNFDNFSMLFFIQNSLCAVDFLLSAIRSGRIINEKANNRQNPNRVQINRCSARLRLVFEQNSNRRIDQKCRICDRNQPNKNVFNKIHTPIIYFFEFLQIIPNCLKNISLTFA